MKVKKTLVQNHANNALSLALAQLQEVYALRIAAQIDGYLVFAALYFYALLMRNPARNVR
jgi:hypothetical protein